MEHKILIDYLNSMEHAILSWTKSDIGPSADGPTFIRGKYGCQVLIPENISIVNAGIEKANLKIWQRETSSVLFLGQIENLSEFDQLCVQLGIW